MSVSTGTVGSVSETIVKDMYSTNKLLTVLVEIYFVPGLEKINLACLVCVICHSYYVIMFSYVISHYKTNFL